MAFEVVPIEWHNPESHEQVLEYFALLPMLPLSKKWAYVGWCHLVHVKVTVDDLYYVMFGRKRHWYETIDGGLREYKPGAR